MAEPAVPPCCGAGKGPDPSLSVAPSASCGLRLELPEGSGHAGGLLPSAIGPLPTHCNPGKAPRPLPLSTFPFARRPRVGGGFLHHGLGARCPATHPKTCLVRATGTHPSSKQCSPACPAPWPRATACLCTATASSHGTLHHPAGSCTLAAPPGLSSCPSSSGTPPLGWPGCAALAVGALPGWHPASCPPVPSQGWDLWVCESDSEPKGNREHRHGGTSAPSLISERGRCPGHHAESRAPTAWHAWSLLGDKSFPCRAWGEASRRAGVLWGGLHSPLGAAGRGVPPHRTLRWSPIGCSGGVTGRTALVCVQLGACSSACPPVPTEMPTSPWLPVDIPGKQPASRSLPSQNTGGCYTPGEMLQGQLPCPRSAAVGIGPVPQPCTALVSSSGHGAGALGRGNLGGKNICSVCRGCEVAGRSPRAISLRPEARIHGR